MDITFDKITLQVTVKKKKKLILDNVSGTFKSGELTAIMGPSGSGKTSLLNILTGFSRTGASGIICDQDFKKQKQNILKNKSSYILQEDHLNPFFTVEETMMLASDLKLNNHLPREKKHKIVSDILDSMGLLNTSNIRCVSLSGGQRKRLSIALELISNPSVMFLDEPTTGLDSSATLQCIQLLKALTDAGRTIVCTIHQPSATIFEMFDHLYVVAEGMCVYQGASKNIVTYLNTFGFECPTYHNPADYLLEITNCEYGNHNKKLADHAKRSCWRNIALVNDEICETHKAEVNNNEIVSMIYMPPTEMYTFWILLKRYMKQQHRDWSLSYIRVVIHIIVSTVLGVVFSQYGRDGAKSYKNLGFLTIGVTYISYMTIMPAVLRFPLDFSLVNKETFNNWYKVRTYYAAAVVCQIPLQCIFILIYSTSSYYMSSQPPEIWRFAMYITVLMFVSLTAEASGHILGTLLNPVSASFIGPLYLALQLLLSGFLIHISDMSTIMRYGSYFAWFRYSLEAVMQTVYGFNRGILSCPDENLYCHFRYPLKLLKDLNYDELGYFKSVLILFGMMLAFKYMAYYLLCRKLKH